MLPRLILIADRFTDSHRTRQVVRAVESDAVPWVQLRDHTAPEDTFLRAARDLCSELREINPEILISVNTRLEIALELEAGIHVGIRGPEVQLVRGKMGDEALIGYSAHSVKDGLAAREQGADYVTFSPVFRTSGKQKSEDASPEHEGGVRGVGLEALGKFCSAVASTPVFALGGISADVVQECLQVGAHGVAVVSAIMDSTNPVLEARRFRHALL